MRATVPTRRIPAGLTLCASLLVGCGSKSALEITPPLDPPALDGGLPDAPPCVPEGERCNGRDDDCDGAVDEDLSFGPLAEPIVLRDDELETGDCTSCRWAWEPVLSPLEDGGYLALFRIGIYGGAEQPNVVTRRLDRRGNPLGPLEVIPDLVLLTTSTLRTSRRPEETTLGVTSIRSITTHRDAVGFFEIDRSGRLEVHETPLQPAASALIGDRLLSVWAEDRARVRIRSTPVAGGAANERDFPLDEVLTVFLGANERELLALALTYVDSIHALHVFTVAADGALLTEPRVIELAYRSYPRVVGTSEGFWVVFSGDRSTPTSLAVLSREGEIVDPLHEVPELGVVSDSGLSDSFTHAPSSPEVVLVHADPYMTASDMVVLRLDERAQITAAWQGPTPGGFVVHPETVFTDDGRILVAWHGIAADSTPNQVYVREFGCVP